MVDFYDYRMNTYVNMKFGYILLLWGLLVFLNSHCCRSKEPIAPVMSLIHVIFMKLVFSEFWLLTFVEPEKEIFQKFIVLSNNFIFRKASIIEADNAEFEVFVMQWWIFMTIE